MRILRILSSRDKGGIYTYEVQFIKELKKRNIVVDAIILGDAEQADAYKNICHQSYYIPHLEASYSGSVINILGAILKSYQFGKKYANVLNTQIKGKFNYDAIIYSRPTYIHLAGILAKKINAKALWHLPNTVNGRLSRNYYNYYCRNYNITQIGNSIFTKNTLGGQCRQVVYPGFDEERVQESASNYREQLGIPINAPVYGVAARIHRDKAQDIVVDAFYTSNIPQLGGHLLVAGGPTDTEFTQETQKLAKDLRGKQIHFLGEINDLPKFYATVDVVINGRRNVEPFGISVAEAFGAGKPVLAYYLGGPSEMVIDKENGWLIKEPTVESYRLALNTSIDDRPAWNLMGQNAKTRSSLYTVKNNVDKLVEIIQNA